MHQVFKLIGQAAKWSKAHPQASAIIARSLGLWYRNLRPNEKQRVNAILRRAAVKLAGLAVGDVVHWAIGEALADGLGEHGARIVEGGVRRVSQVGIERALKEIEHA